MEQTKYDVFISYSRKDYVDEQKNVIPGNEVSKIKEALTEKGIKFWMDEKGVIPGEDYAAKITKHIKACKIFLYISSKAANDSDWTRKEIATALMYKKYIIPLLLDDSPFHDSVILRIADLERIDYYVNPQLGLEKLVRTIKTFLEETEEEEKRKKEVIQKKEEERRKKEEEEKKKREQEEKRQQQEQEELVRYIGLTNKTLNNEETKLLIERENLLLKTETVFDLKKRDALKKDIQKGGPISQKCNEDCLNLRKEIDKLNDSIQIAEEKNAKKLEGKEEMIAQLKKELQITKDQLENLSNCPQDNLQGKDDIITRLKEELRTSKTQEYIFERKYYQLVDKISELQNSQTTKEISRYKAICFAIIPGLLILCFFISLIIFHYNYEYTTYWKDEDVIVSYFVSFFVMCMVFYYWLTNKFYEKIQQFLKKHLKRPEALNILEDLYSMYRVFTETQDDPKILEKPER